MSENKVKSIAEYIEEYLSVRQRPQGELLQFRPGDDRDVYNCSVPFDFEGKTYIWGRVEKRTEWATSVTMLFECKADGTFVRVEGVETYPLEDPFFLKIAGEYILGGTHVVKEKGKIKTYYVDFYRGKSPFALKYFTTGPDFMKDIRLVELPDGKIGVFSRPRCDDIMEKYGTISQVGYTVIDSLDDLDAEVIEKAAYIPEVFGKMEWGGVNQPVALQDDLIGLIGHQGYTMYENGVEYPIYVNVAYVYRPSINRILEKKVIGVRSDYPDAECKRPALAYCAFTSGICDAADDGKVILYSGLGDSCEGKVEIPDPFRSYRL